MTKRLLDEVVLDDNVEPTKIAKPNPIQGDPDIDVRKVKSLLLSRLNGKQLPNLSGLDKEYNTLYKLLKQTVSTGESNSCLIVGNRGTGKSALVRTVLQDLKDLENDFCVVKLNGLTEVNDRLALNEISRQLVTEQHEQADRTFVKHTKNKNKECYTHSFF